MNVVVSIMRQHRRIQRLDAAVVGHPRQEEPLVFELLDAVLFHVGTEEAAIAAQVDGPLSRVIDEHCEHHARARVAAFRIATCDEARVGAELALFREVLHAHAQHEMSVIQGLRRSFGEDGLVALGARMAAFEQSRPMPLAKTAWREPSRRAGSMAAARPCRE